MKYLHNTETQIQHHFASILIQQQSFWTQHWNLLFEELISLTLTNERTETYTNQVIYFYEQAINELEKNVHQMPLLSLAFYLPLQDKVKKSFHLRLQAIQSVKEMMLSREFDSDLLDDIILTVRHSDELIQSI